MPLLAVSLAMGKMTVINLMGKSGISGKNKAPGLFDQAIFRGLFVIVLFRHPLLNKGSNIFPEQVLSKVKNHTCLFTDQV
jgi:hypothetical protein